MEEEFKTLSFPNSEEGQRQKVEALRIESAKGWRLVSETITADSVDVGSSARNAACLCFLCGPFCTPFLMDPTKKSGSINVTLARSLADREKEEEVARQQLAHEAEENRKYALALEEDAAKATVEKIIGDYMAETGQTYISKYLTKALRRYLSQKRKAFGAIPCIQSSKREGGYVILVAKNGEILARYSMSSLSEDPDY